MVESEPPPPLVAGTPPSEVGEETEPPVSPLSGGFWAPSPDKGRLGGVAV